MNLEGADVERHLGVSVMPQFHAAFSGGTVVSALVGAAMSWAGVPLTAHFLGAAVVTVVLGLVGAPAASCRAPPSTTRPPSRPRRRHRCGLARAAHPAHRGRRLRRRLHRGHGQRLARRRLRRGPRAAGVGRGPRVRDLPHLHDARPGSSAPVLLDRYGRVPVLRVSFALAALGAGPRHLRRDLAGVRRRGRLGRRRGARLPRRDERLRRRPRARRGPDVGRRDDRLRRLPRRAARCSGCSATGSACCARCSSSGRSPSSPWRSSPPCASPPGPGHPIRAMRTPREPRHRDAQGPHAAGP